MVATNPSDIAAGAGGFDPYGPDFRAAVQLIIDRHAAHAPEADIRAAIGSFLIFTGLASADDLRREQDRIDLQSSDLIIETKRRIGSKAGFYPAQDNVRQLDDYMEASIARGDPRRLGVLTDGRYWLLRLYGMEEVNTAPPFGFELRRPNDGIRWRPPSERRWRKTRTWTGCSCCTLTCRRWWVWPCRAPSAWTFAGRPP